MERQLTILQHDRTPLDGLSPTITIRNGGATKSFAAKPTGKTGVYKQSFGPFAPEVYRVPAPYPYRGPSEEEWFAAFERALVNIDVGSVAAAIVSTTASRNRVCFTGPPDPRSTDRTPAASR